jgi:hypothetical protein
MDSKILTRMTDLLQTDPDFFVPVKKLWLMLQAEGLELDLEEFQQLLQEDERFEMTPGEDHREGFETDPKLIKEMENLGIYTGSKIKLASREMTAEDIFTGMTRSLNRMNQALQNAWEARPPEDQETEDQLLEILAAGQRLEQEIQRLVNQQDSLARISKS